MSCEILEFGRKRIVSFMSASKCILSGIQWLKYLGMTRKGYYIELLLVSCNPYIAIKI